MHNNKKIKPKKEPAQEDPGQFHFDFSNSLAATAAATNAAEVPPDPVTADAVKPADAGPGAGNGPPMKARATRRKNSPAEARAAKRARIAASRKADKANGVVRPEIKMHVNDLARIDAEADSRGISRGEAVKLAMRSLRGT